MSVNVKLVLLLVISCVNTRLLVLGASLWNSVDDKQLPQSATDWLDEDLDKKELLKTTQRTVEQECSVVTKTAIVIPRPDKALLVMSLNNWILVQNKVLGGATSFGKQWAEYRDGFGSLTMSDNYWIGLDHIHRLTSAIPQYKLRVEIQRSSSPMWYYAEYASFSVSSESTGFQLLVSGYQGNAGDAMSGAAHSDWISNGRKFTTTDKEHDTNAKNCGALNGSGWWFWDCSVSNINKDDLAWWHSGSSPVGDVIRARMMIKLA